MVQLPYSVLNGGAYLGLIGWSYLAAGLVTVFCEK